MTFGEGILSFSFLRDAAWITEERLRHYSAMLIAIYAAAALWALTGHGISDPTGRPVGTDFVSFWTVSWALLHEQAAAIYAPDKLALLEQTVAPHQKSLIFAWSYPPIALLIVYPLALLPYLWSLGAWLSVGLAAYLTALWRILPRPIVLLSGLAFPAVFLAIAHGQNALLVTGVLGWALVLLRRRPGVAGMLFGVLSFKPHLGLLIPIALLAGGYWRAIVSAALTVLGLAAIATVLFGIHIWADFLASAPFTRRMLEEGLVWFTKLQSPFSAVRLLDGPTALAYGVQAAASLAAALIVAWAWRRNIDDELKNAALVTAIPLATPFVLDYDLLILALPINWLVARSLRCGALPWERTALIAASLTPLLSRTIGAFTHVLIAPAVVAALLITIVVRIGASSGKQMDGGGGTHRSATPGIAPEAAAS